MDVMQIMQRSLSGYIFAAPGVLLYFILQKKTGKGQTGAHIAGALIFGYYLIGVLTMTGIGKIKAFSPNFVWIPFAEMISGPADAALNLLLFVPLGFFLPLLYGKYDRISRTAAAGFGLSLSVEIIQMFGRGATDVNDLITNTAGACLGYFMYRLLASKVQKQLTGQFRAAGISGSGEVLLFTAYSFLIMVTVQPLMIHTLFRLG